MIDKEKNISIWTTFQTKVDEIKDWLIIELILKVRQVSIVSH